MKGKTASGEVLNLHFSADAGFRDANLSRPPLTLTGLVELAESS